MLARASSTFQVVDENTVSESNKPNKRLVGEVLVRLYGSYNYLYVDPVKNRSAFENILMQNNNSYSETFQKALEQDLSHIKSGRLKRRVSEPRVKAEAPKDKKLKQDGTKKNQEGDGSPRQGTSGKLLDERSQGTKGRKVDLVAEKSKNEASKNKKPKQDSIKKKSKADNQDYAKALEKARDEASKNKKTKQGNVMKNSEADKQASARDSPGKPQAVSPSQAKVQKRQKANSPGSAMDPLEKSRDLSARRIRVMQSLGLVAPCGSPFHRNGLIVSTM